MTVHSTPHLLVLDDERAVVDALCAIANSFGYKSRGSYTHSSALAIAHDFQPDVFLTGFNNLSEKNGCETALEILAFLPACRVVICSGSASAADAISDYRQRGFEFEILPKPVHPQDLLAILRSRNAGR